MTTACSATISTTFYYYFPGLSVDGEETSQKTEKTGPIRNQAESKDFLSIVFLLERVTFLYPRTQDSIFDPEFFIPPRVGILL